jgi:hypothetical protein
MQLSKMMKKHLQHFSYKRFRQWIGGDEDKGLNEEGKEQRKGEQKKKL